MNKPERTGPVIMRISELL